MPQSIDSNSSSHPARKPAVSDRKLAANRANAQHSTGPRTPQGKARAAMNALRHGILAKSAFNVTIEGDGRRAEFEGILAGLAQEYQPQTTTEVMAVQQLAGCYWKLAKVWRYEQERTYCEWNMYDGSEETRGCNKNNVFELMEDRQHAIDNGEFLRKAGLVTPTIPNASASTILRYQGAINAMMTRCIALLERRRMQRTKSPEYFEELNYLNEAIAPEPGEEDSKESAVPAKDGALHKRTQRASTNAGVSVATNTAKPSAAPAPSADTPRDGRDSA